MKMHSYIVFTIIFFSLSSNTYADLLFTKSYDEWTPDPECPFPSSEIIYFPVPGDCSKYIECVDGVKTEHQCSDGLWWHQLIHNCDYPGDYCDPNESTTSTATTTPTRTTTLSTAKTPTTTTSTRTTTLPTTTEGYGPDPRCNGNATSYWPHPKYCSRYIECHEGNSYEMTCPAGLYFSNLHKMCVNAVDSDCCAEKPDQCT